jgi:hypothetical protein
MMVAIRFKKSSHYYAEWVLIGGNCAVVADKPGPDLCKTLNYVGCGLFSPALVKYLGPMVQVSCGRKTRTRLETQIALYWARRF